jgi:hypothetical protein
MVKETHVVFIEQQEDDRVVQNFWRLEPVPQYYFNPSLNLQNPDPPTIVEIPATRGRPYVY